MSDEDSFIREVTEEVRQDRLFRFWKRYGAAVIGAILVAVAVSAGWTWYQQSERAAARERGGMLIAAGDDPAALQDAVDRLDPPAEVVAEMRLAAAEAEAGNADAAIARYDRVAEATALGPAYADLARLKAARLALPRLSEEAAEARLSPLIAPDAPYRLLALELRAALRLNAGWSDGARADLETILSAPGLTQDLAARARQMLQVIGPAPATAGEAAGGSGGAGGGSAAEDGDTDG